MAKELWKLLRSTRCLFTVRLTFLFTWFIAQLIFFDFSYTQQQSLTVRPFEENFPALKRVDHFERYNTEHGLSTTLCTTAPTMDSKGFLWVGTAEGLNRFDGHKFVVYRNDPRDSNSISANYIRTVYEDRYHELWVAVNGGLNEYDRKSNKFYRHQHNINDSASISDDNVTSIFEDRRGTLWIGTENGLNRLVRNIAARGDRHSTFVRYFYDPLDSLSLSSNWILSIYDDSKGKLWIQTSRGVDEFDKKANTFLHFKVDPRVPRILEEKSIRHVYEDRSGAIWISTNEGLFRVEQETKSITHFKADPQNPHSLSSNLITSVYQDKLGTIWVVTDTSGINELERAGGKFIQHRYSRDNAYSLSHDDVGLTRTISEDGAGNLWISLLRYRGLNKLTRRARQFKTFTVNTANSEENLVEYNLALSESTLWTQGTGYLRKYSKSPLPREWPRLSHVFILLELDQDVAWLGTRNHGLVKLNLRSGEQKAFISAREEESSIGVSGICYDSTGVLWIVPGGLRKFDPRLERYTAVYKHDPMNPNSIRSNYAGRINMDRQGYVWIGTPGFGLDRFNPSTEKFTFWTHNPNDSTSISHTTAHLALDTGDEALWFGTALGLNRFDKQAGTFRSYRRGGNSETVYQVIADMNGNIWIGYAEGGIARLNISTGVLTSYTTRDGLPTNRFDVSGRAFLRSNGEIVLPGALGFIIVFHPDSLLRSNFMPKIALTGFSVLGVGKHLPETHEGYEPITLPHDSAFFVFEFASLDLTVPERNQHAYMLEGYEDNWNHVGTDREAHYTKVPHGEYVFRVKGTNSDGIWSTNEASIRITVLPPWWQTTWAYFGYAMIAGLAFYSARRYELGRVKLKHQVELDNVRIAKMLEVNQMKSRFFANISHEFRTPLTLILGPIKKWKERSNSEQRVRRSLSEGGSEESESVSEKGPILDSSTRKSGSQNDSSELHTDMSMAERNAQRLLRLINQLLDLSKLEAGSMKLRAAPDNIVPFVKGIAHSFESSGGKRNITLTIETAAEEIEVYFDKDKLEKVFVNLLSNAFKFTQDGGNVSVTLSPLPDRLAGVNEGRGEGYVQVSVSDTGIGIPADQLDKIFDRFYQVDASHTREREGTGIGLALSRELVGLHSGTLTVHSEVGKGTTFTVRLPLGRDHLRDEEIEVDKELKLSPESLRAKPTPLESEATALPTAELVPSVECVPHNDASPLVLVVEDNADVREYIRRYLDPAYNVLEARDGAEGVEKAKDEIPDLVVSDVMMPKMDGYELCKTLKLDEKTSHVPIILLTAKAGQENKLEGLETGADAYLVKPFDAKELLVRVRNLIEQRRKLRERYEKDLLVKPAVEHISSLEEQFLSRLVGVVEAHLADETFSVEELGKEAGMSRSQIHRKLHALTNQSASEFIRHIRLRHAMDLLKNNAGTVSEIAYSVGFSSPAYFTKCFHEEFGSLPSDIRKG